MDNSETNYIRNEKLATDENMNNALVSLFSEYQSEKIRSNCKIVIK